MSLELLHPMVVHFPIAFLIGGFAAHAVRHLVRRPETDWLESAEAWLLWLGTAAIGVALALGLLAERNATHVPAAWRTLRDHRELALWTTGLFLTLSVWRRFFHPRAPQLFTLAWGVSVGLLVVVGHYGAQLVFKFGMAVGRSQ